MTLLHSSITVMRCCVENLLRPTSRCAEKITAPNKMLPKAQIASLMLSFSLPHCYFTLSCTHEKRHKCVIISGGKK